MNRFVLLAFGALSVIKMDGAYAQDVPDCVPGCSNQTRGQFANFSCASADDAACLCAAPNFFFGVRDCAPACASDTQVYDFLTGSFCQGQTIPYTPTAALPSSSPTLTVSLSEPLFSSSPPTSAPPTESPTTPPPTSEAPSATAAPTVTDSTGLTGSTSAPTAAPTASPPAITESAAPTELPTSTSSPSPSETSESASRETSVESKPSSGSGLSPGAAAGIGVGVTVAVLAIAGIAGFFVVRNRKHASAQSIDISKSFPGSGQGHQSRDQGPFEKYANDIEMVANRYEDMVPRAQPRC